MKYKLIRSKRRTIQISIDENCELIVRAPYRLSKSYIDAFLDSKSDWIGIHMERAKRKQKEALEYGYFTEEDLQELKKKAKTVISGKVSYYSEVLKVTYGRISVRAQKTRWGSCSAEGNLNFNCLLMLMPERVVDYVVVHELCHRIYMNHSKQFWQKVESVIPDYRECKKVLKDKGEIYIRMLQNNQVF
ncbi:MAG: M48 family metallopeptidase [Acetatifactor sp.]|nr:M48 family metallopeptidase [Acetatifactor sp.]